MPETPKKLELIRAAQAGNVEARNQLVEQDLPLIFYCLKRITQLQDVSDFLSLGFFSYLKALSTFDPDYGAKFSTYLYGGIRFDVKSYWSDKTSHADLPLDQVPWENQVQKGIEVPYRVELLKEAVKSLPPRSALILKRLLSGKTEKSVGKLFDVSKSCISQIKLKQYQAIRRFIEREERKLESRS